MKLKLGLIVPATASAVLIAVGCTNDIGYIESGIAAPANAEAADAHSRAMSRMSESRAMSRMSESSKIEDQSRSETRSLAGEKFRVKDSELLRGTLSCVGDNVAALVTVPADAIRSNPLGQQAAPTAGKLRVLPFGSVMPNANIIDVKKADLYDPAAEGRDSAASPEATASYLNAATLVAEVVAHNADVANPTSKAYCRTPQAARALLQRCVPSIKSEQLNVVIEGKSIPESLAAECDKGASAAEKDLNSRVALASFLGSWLFLKSER